MSTVEVPKTVMEKILVLIREFHEDTGALPLGDDYAELVREAIDYRVLDGGQDLENAVIDHEPEHDEINSVDGLIK